MLATLLDVGSKPTTSTNGLYSFRYNMVLGDKLYSFEYNGGEWLWHGDKDIRKVDTQLTGEQVELAMAA